MALLTNKSVPMIPVSVIQEIEDAILDASHFSISSESNIIRETEALNIIDEHVNAYLEKYGS